MQLQPPTASGIEAPVHDHGSGHERSASQLFTSVPALSEVASYITETTSYFTRCLTGSSGEASLDLEEQELMTLPCSYDGSSTPQDGMPSFRRWTSLFEPSSDNHSTSNSSLGSQGLAGLTSTTTGNGTSIFQSLIERARKTVRGSVDDIGWLQHAPGMPSIEDGTRRYSEILNNIRKNEHKLPNTMVYLLIPGLFSNHGPMYFVSTKTFFSKRGLACHIAKIHSEASVERNAKEIKEYIEEIYWGAKKRVLLLGHSKGGVDAAAALSLYWSDLKDKVAGLALAQSPYGGSPIASDILRDGQLGDYVHLRKLMEILVCKVLKGDLQALEDLTYERRKSFLTEHPLPPELPVVSLNTEAAVGPSVLSSLSHVAHAEIPGVAPLLYDGQPTKVPVVMPLAAAMAACAQLLQVRYGEKSDGLVTRRDAEVPGSVVVHPEKKMDHAWMVYASVNDDRAGETKASQVCEALLTLLLEVAQKRRREIAQKLE